MKVMIICDEIKFEDKGEIRSNITITKHYLPPRKIFKVGDIVDLDIDALENTDDWKDYKGYYGNGKGLEIKRIDNNTEGLNYLIYTKDKSDDYFIGANYILPHEEETPKEDILIKDGKQYKVIIVEEIK